MMMTLPMVSLTVFVVMLAAFVVVVGICHSRKPVTDSAYDPDAEFQDLCERLRHPIRRQWRRFVGSRRQPRQ